MWRPHKGAQEAFHKASAFEIGYGGAAGGGKTESLLRELLRQVHKPGYKAVFFRRTYPELENSAIDRAFQIYPQHGGEPKDKGRKWQFKTKGTYSQIIFSHLEHDSDVHKYQSTQFDVIALDEATSFTEYQYTYMRSRIRGTDPDIQRYYLLATNPGNIGHTWFKSRFIDGKEPFKKYGFKIQGEEEIQGDVNEKDILTRVFIPAKVWDNPTLVQNDPQYISRLKSLDSVTRRMLLDGDWDVFAGQYFSDFRRNVHIIEPFAIPEGWKRFVGIDYGSSAAYAAVFVAFDYDGNCYVYNEYYQKGKTAYQNAKGVQDLYWDKERDIPKDKISAFFMDPSVFGGVRTENGETIADITKNARPVDGFHGLPIRPAANRRVDGWNTVKEFLNEVNGRPKLRIFRNCTNLIQYFPQMIFDKYNPEDLDTTMEDHILDALRYVLQTLRDKKSHPILSSIEEKIMKRFRPKQDFNPNSQYAPR